jgi:deferrochelatase/peroxidase EfeB
MIQSMVTIAAPLAVEKIAQAVALIEALGNPASPVVALDLRRLDGDAGVHFASLHAIAPTDTASATGHLVLEFSADGAEAAAIALMVDRLGARLRPIFELSSDRPGADLPAYFAAHSLKLGVGWMGRTGLAFAGTPGMSVGRIVGEAALSKRLASELENQPGGVEALDRLERVRAAIRADADFAWALETPDAAPVAPNLNPLALTISLAASFVTTFLWPLAIPLAIVLGFGVHGVWGVVRDVFEAGLPIGRLGWTLFTLSGTLLSWLFVVFLAFAVPLLILAGALYLSLRAKEQSDWLDTRTARRDVLHAILARENQCAQNHMVSITQRKPGLTRRITARLAFWIIGALATRQFEPGHLGDIGTIHFARWVMLPGGRDFVFFSNYGGSWESYLEDFITKAHAGLTAVWSNTVGFPVTENLFELGATDGERFKRYARRSMMPTPFWFSAYPDLTTDNIRTNAAVRSGLAAAMTNEEATSWLAQFGSSQRPAVKLESNEIQSLVFGGLGFMPHGRVMLVDLAANTPAVRSWLKAIEPEVAFDDGRRLRHKAVVTLALGPGALAGAGLPPDALETFPAAFLDGMTGPGRARILGDDDKTDDWWWGADRQHDVALLIYGVNAEAVQALADRIAALTTQHGHTLAHGVDLAPVPNEVHEPFGFLDGVSQPVIRGSYQGLRSPDAINLVEPGEFILGYPDNRGNLPPGPALQAIDDPDNRLPIHCDGTGSFSTSVVDAPREIGRNGSFLVIRQLEQDHDAFWSYCETQAELLKHRLPAPYVIDKTFIGAKMIGRWPNGSSLVRNPYLPYGAAGLTPSKPTRRPESNPAGVAPSIAPAPAAPPDAAASNADPNAADNDFLFGAEDPQGLRCPYGAHIRRANPRDSLDPGSQDQIDISNRHRILRVGRAYAPAEGQKPGLLFMCLNGDIERQFEFVQQTWLGSETFHGLSGERDPIAGNSGKPSSGFTIPTRDGPVRLKPLARFVTPRGGGYFFLPSKTFLDFLGA